MSPLALGLAVALAVLWRWFFLQTRDTTVTRTPGHEHTCTRA
jgi:hypothetical protein